MVSVLIAAILYSKPCRFLRTKAYNSETCQQQQFALFEIHGLVSNDRFPWMPRIEVDMYPLFSRVFILCCREWKALLEREWDLGKFVAEEVFSLLFLFCFWGDRCVVAVLFLAWCRWMHKAGLHPAAGDMCKRRRTGVLSSVVCPWRCSLLSGAVGRKVADHMLPLLHWHGRFPF